ncbi:MAG: hypothetical protein DI595_02395 [Agrobacterium fabrum]|uniref:AlpA family phage regulatory protein n=1 Tax=Agrobacterium fabrum TaxID=1176649 RepID=A0A2W5HJ37_9HYPH|nr:MAG: hypothetical protein DI595_02395 [Agrobacterium fabrum]
MPNTTTPCILLDSAAIKKVAPVSNMTLWRWMRDGKFPSPLKVAGRNFWKSDEIEAWINDLSAKRHVHMAIPGKVA